MEIRKLEPEKRQGLVLVFTGRDADSQIIDRAIRSVRSMRLNMHIAKALNPNRVLTIKFQAQAFL